MKQDELIAPGHTACAGCGEILGVKLALRAIGKNCVVCLATGCMEITTTKYPTTSWKVPLVHVTFENACAVASGVARALKMQRREDVNVIAMAGDGGLADIGFQAMSGALERNENVLVICTDNEAYMNTGIQRSSCTPQFASTKTSPAGSVVPGKRSWKKNLAFIAAAHGIPYVATASPVYPQDLEQKIKKALTIKGPKFISIFSACPEGWKYDSARTIEIGKLAVETGMWALYEIEKGKLKVNVKPKKLKPVAEYTKLQKRFKHLKKEQLAELQRRVAEEYEKLLEKEKLSK